MFLFIMCGPISSDFSKGIILPKTSESIRRVMNSISHDFVVMVVEADKADIVDGYELIRLDTREEFYKYFKHKVTYGEFRAEHPMDLEEFYEELYGPVPEFTVQRKLLSDKVQAYRFSTVEGLIYLTSSTAEEIRDEITPEGLVVIDRKLFGFPVSERHITIEDLKGRALTKLLSLEGKYPELKV